MVKFPVNPEPPKKMPDAIASFFASWNTLSTLCEKREPSSAWALNALSLGEVSVSDTETNRGGTHATVLKAFNFSSAVYTPQTVSPPRRRNPPD